MGPPADRIFESDFGPSSLTPRYDSGGAIIGHSPSMKQRTGMIGGHRLNANAPTSTAVTAATCQVSPSASAEQSRFPT